MSRGDFYPGWKMTCEQRLAYFSLWQSVINKHGWNKAEAEAQRLLAHARAFGGPKSRKDIDHRNNFSAIKGEFMALLRPDDLQPQMRQISMPERNLRWKVMNVQTALLAVVLEHAETATELDRQTAAENYVLAIMKDKFRTTDLKDVNDRRPHPGAYSDLEKLVFTIDRAIGKLRRAYEERTKLRLPMHEMHQLAGVACGSNCRQCRPTALARGHAEEGVAA